MSNTKTASIFVAGLKSSPGPWHVKTVGSPAQPEYQLCDFHGKPIAYILAPHPDTCTTEQFHYNKQALRQLPQIIAALLECTYTLENSTGDRPTPNLVELIRTSSGIDLTNSESQTTEDN